MHKRIKYSVCFLITLFLFSCNNDELVKNQKNEEARENLKLDKFSNPNIVENVEVDFENVKEFEKDNFKISEIAANEKVVNYLQSDLLQNQLRYQVITIEHENKAYSYLLEIYTHKKSTAYPMTITKLKDFSGTFNVYFLDGKNLGSVGLTKGIAKNISEKEDLNILTRAINLFSDNSNLANRIPPCNTPYYQPMQFTIYWHTEVIVDNAVISYVLSNVTTETIVVETSYPCDAAPEEVARAYRYEIIGRSGSGGSGTTPAVPSTEDYLPPSCKSFTFKTKSGANWQEALVKNIQFKVVLITEKGAELNHYISFPQAVSFGMAVNFNKGNGDVTAGVAAEISAEVLQESMRKTVALYGKTNASELTVSLYFQKQLKQDYKDYTNGGIVNFNSISTQAATNYITNAQGTGFCN